MITSVDFDRKIGYWRVNGKPVEWISLDGVEAEPHVGPHFPGDEQDLMHALEYSAFAMDSDDYTKAFSYGRVEIGPLVRGVE